MSRTLKRFDRWVGWPVRCIAIGLVFACLTFAHTNAAQPLDTSSRPEGITLAQIDDSLVRFHLMLEEAQRQIDSTSPDHAGRTLEQDFSELVLPPSELDRYSELRNELPQQIPEGTERVPLEAALPMARIVMAAACRAAMLTSYWQLSQIRDYQRALLSIQMAGLPEAERSILRAQIAGLDARAALLRQAAVRITTSECANQKFEEKLVAENEAVVAGFNELRERIADLSASSIATEPAMQTRPTACPPAVSGTSGSPIAKHKIVPDVTDYYPDDMRRYSVEGIVHIAVKIDAGGCVQAAGVKRSSGADQLDQAGIEVAFLMQFTPAEVNGKASESIGVIPIRFRLPN
jgi:TonB family protein